MAIDKKQYELAAIEGGGHTGYKVYYYHDRELGYSMRDGAYALDEAFYKVHHAAYSAAVKKANTVIDYTTMDDKPIPKETTDMRPKHYHNAPFDVMEVQGYIMSNYIALCPGIKDGVKHAAKAWAVGAAVKHLCRLGLKDPVDTDLAKAENYLHYARTGEWIQ